MKLLILLFLNITTLTGVFAQASLSYYKKIAGDTALYIGRDNVLFKKHLQDTLSERFNAGTYRIVLNPNIDVEDIEIKIVNRQNQSLLVNKNERFIDFTNPSTSSLSFILHLKTPFSDEIIGRTFWIYSKETFKESRSFQITDIDGTSYNLKSLKGKVVVFNFWGIQCGPCKKEIPRLNNLVKQYANRDDVIFLAVSGDSKKQLKEFLQHTKFDYHIVSERDFLQTKIVDYDGLIWPSHAVLNKEGKVVFKYLGTHPAIEKMLTESVEKYL